MKHLFQSNPITSLLYLSHNISKIQDELIGPKLNYESVFDPTRAVNRNQGFVGITGRNRHVALLIECWNKNAKKPLISRYELIVPPNENQNEEQASFLSELFQSKSAKIFKK